uniref:SLIT-ROBO Rho GTPase-activating protein 1 n=1 Tax=Strigamia maritima TaxID=126957 RepID=T1IUP1_STRMM
MTSFEKKQPATKKEKEMVLEFDGQVKVLNTPLTSCVGIGNLCFNCCCIEIVFRDLWVIGEHRIDPFVVVDPSVIDHHNGEVLLASKTEFERADLTSVGHGERSKHRDNVGNMLECIIQTSWINNPELKEVFPDVRQQLNEQLKCLDVRMETQVAIVAEIQDFFRRRAELETEYSKNLDKLAKSLSMRHKAEKQKREQWHLFSTYSCWQELINSTKRDSRDHAVLGDIYGANIIERLGQAIEDVQRMYKRCREIGYESHEELLKVLHELHTAMKTYHTYHGEMKQAEGKLRYVENQRNKLEQTIPREKLDKIKKFRLIEKEIQKRLAKFNDCKTKAVKARNEYLLCMEAANAAVHKYFVDDLSDLMDCMDFGFHNSIARSLMLYVSSDECMKKSRQLAIDNMNKGVSNLDSRLDKQRFLEHNNSCFMMPRKFEFSGLKGDESAQFHTDKNIVDELDQRQKQLARRITALKTESEEIWKTLVTAEKSLMDMINQKDYDCSSPFSEKPPEVVKQPEAVALKLRADRQETEDFYLNKFREYTLGSNLIARLQSKQDLLHGAFGDRSIQEEKIGLGQMINQRQMCGKPRKRRIGRTPLVGQPKLFGGSLEEYLEATNQEIPLIMRSCIRLINLYGLHHQGVFRVSGSQLEISNFKESFEREEDPLADMTDASDINSVSGLLKLYLRELREPLFPIYYFDQFMELSQLESKTEFVSKVRSLITSLPRPVLVVMRYLFAFLNHLSEFSDENMMDPYNLAICFGPTLVPIPEDRDQVLYQNLVNELTKSIIIYQEEIFPPDGGLMYEKYISTNIPDDNEVGEAPAEHICDDDVNCHSEDAEQAVGERDISMQFFGKSEVLEAIAQFDFTARSERELTFKKGDLLTLYSQVSNDWWKGSFEGAVGLIPDKYILLRMRDEDREKGSSEENMKPRRASVSSDSCSGGSPKPRSVDTSRRDNSKGLSHSASASQISNASFSVVEERRRRSQSPTTPKIKRKENSQLELTIETAIDSSKVPPVAGTPTTNQTNVAHPSVSPGVTSPDIERDLDSALAQVFSSLETLEKKSRNKDTPDLVLDLPVNPSSPRSKGQRSISAVVDQSPCDESESPELTAAERFAQSNQCTMKKNGQAAMSRSVTQMSPVSDIQIIGLKRSTSVTSEKQLVETIEIGGGQANTAEERLSTFKPPVKVKPPVMKKPILPPPSPGGAGEPRELKQTSC